MAYYPNLQHITIESTNTLVYKTVIGTGCSTSYSVGSFSQAIRSGFSCPGHSADLPGKKKKRRGGNPCSLPVNAHWIFQSTAGARPGAGDVVFQRASVRIRSDIRASIAALVNWDSKVPATTCHPSSQSWEPSRRSPSSPTVLSPSPPRPLSSSDPVAYPDTLRVSMCIVSLLTQNVPNES